MNTDNNSVDTYNEPSNKRVAKQHKKKQAAAKKTGLERTHAKNLVVDRLLAGELSQGQALKILRIDVLAMQQASFATIVKVSRKTLSDIENDKGNYSVATLNQVFRPFGLQMGLQRINRS